MNAIGKLGFAVLLLAVSASVLAREGAGEEQGPSQVEDLPNGLATETTALWFTRVYEDIMLSAAQGKLARLERAMEEVQQHWVLGRRTMHLEAMLVLCWQLHQMHSDDRERQLGLLLRCAETVFEKEPLVPAEMQILIVRLLMQAAARYRTALSEKAWVDFRRRTARLLFHTWRRVSKAIDPDYDYLDKPWEERTPEELQRMPGLHDGPGTVVIYPPGTAPRLPTDPATQRRYEEAIEENRKKRRMQKKQIRVRDLLRESSRQAEEYLADMYGTQPSDIQELRDLLEDYGLDKEIAAKVLEAVPAAEGDEQKPRDE